MTPDRCTRWGWPRPIPRRVSRALSLDRAPKVTCSVWVSSSGVAGGSRFFFLKDRLLVNLRCPHGPGWWGAQSKGAKIWPPVFPAGLPQLSCMLAVYGVSAMWQVLGTRRREIHQPYPQGAYSPEGELTKERGGMTWSVHCGEC